MKMGKIILSAAVVFSIGLCGCSKEKNKVLQITNTNKNHVLGIFNAFSPDDKWVVYCGGPNHLNDIVEKVNIETGEVVRLYKIDNQTEFGPGCGTPSYCPTKNEIVFIHGPRKFSPGQKYEFWRRSAVVIKEPNYNKPIFIDARDVTEPFTIGASRGGTHCHEFNYSGDSIAFTYNDMVMAKKDETLNLRTIGVSKNIKSVAVDEDLAKENFDGAWFTAILVEVVPNPKPGSDEICKAYENCWAGNNKIAFKGKTIDKDGNEVPEVYIVNVPDNIPKATDSNHPLQGTNEHMPYPPAEVKWKRLTHTESRKYPGLSTEPRFWLRADLKGERVFFLARDDDGINQVYYVPAVGGDIVQITKHDKDVVSTVSISPDDRHICYICDGSVFVAQINSGKSKRLIEPDSNTLSIPIWSNSGNKIAFCKTSGNYTQVFIINL